MPGFRVYAYICLYAKSCKKKLAVRVSAPLIRDLESHSFPTLGISALWLGMWLLGSVFNRSWLQSRILRVAIVPWRPLV